MQDSFLQQGLRRKLVEQLQQKGISNEQVLAAIAKIPRHLFLDSSFVNYAYEDRPFSIGAGQTISQPTTVAIQTQLLELKKFDKVLEIGTGSGYQAAVLAEMGASVYTVERQRELYIKSQRILKKLHYHVHAFWGDGYEGKPSYAPFNKILITAAVPQVPPKLLEQLVIGGRLVAPVGDTVQVMTVVERLDGKQFKTTLHGNFLFVPMLEGTNP